MVAGQFGKRLANFLASPLRIRIPMELQNMFVPRLARWAANLAAMVLIGTAVPATAEQRTPYTEAELENAIPMGIPEVRAWGDAPLSVLKTQLANLGPLLTGEPVSMLALSGGGEHGAFGAGLLCGWSESGYRPTFDIVTGVSTGALMSPFAFLGSKYDDRLKALYTQMTFHSAFFQGIHSWGSSAKDCIAQLRYNESWLAKSTKRCLTTLLPSIATRDVYSLLLRIWTLSGQCSGTWALWRPAVIL